MILYESSTKNIHTSVHCPHCLTCECLHEHGDYILEKQEVKDIRGLLYKSNEYLTGSKVEEKLPTTAINLLVNSFL